MSARPAGPIASALLVAASALAIARVQPAVAAQMAAVKETSDSYNLPPPDQLPVVSLGYRAAAADLIWAALLVMQGLRITERRHFDHGARYFESIFALEPTYREPYLFLDAILSFGAKRATVEDITAARRLYEFGARARPNDGDLFLQAGGFLAYIAPSYLPEADQKEWRLAGARMLRRASELGAGKMMVSWHSLAGASVLAKNGQRDAAIDFLQRTYQITEDPELREQILVQLGSLQAQDAADRVRAVNDRFEALWRGELPFVDHATILLLGPRVDAAGCAGLGRDQLPGCARDWATWIERGP